MEAISNALDRSISYLSTMGLSDFIDILIVAYILYKAITFVKKTNAFNLAKGLILFVLVLAISELFSLSVINFLLRNALELGLIALLILFQPEIRRVLERMGAHFLTSRSGNSTDMDSDIAQIILACKDMSDSRTGALIVFERNVSLTSTMGTGTVVNADITAELIKNIFFNKAPLHDGALIIRDSKIAAAGCTLPLTQKVNLSKELGMRHKAGLGMSEHSDAVIVIVSEETGAISLAIDGMLKRHLNPAMLDKLLHKELQTQEDKEAVPNSFVGVLKNCFKVKNHEEKQSND